MKIQKSSFGRIVFGEKIPYSLPMKSSKQKPNTVVFKSLDRSRNHDFQLEIVENELNQLCHSNAWRKLKIEHFKGKLISEDGAWLLEGHIKGVLTQSCVISGAPVIYPLDFDVRRRYLEQAQAIPQDFSWNLEFETDEEPMPPSVNLVDVLSEAVLLESPEFPKLPKYENGETWQYQPTLETEEEESQKPFANLKDLMAKKNSGES